MMPDPNLQKAAAAYAIDRLPEALRHELLSEPDLLHALPLEIFSAVPSRTGENLSRDRLFAAFRAVLAGAGDQVVPTQPPSENSADVTFELDAGVGVFTIGDYRHRIENADLLADDKAVRLAAFKRATAQRHFSIRLDRHYRMRLSADDFVDGDFLDIVAALENTPQAFAEHLRSQTKTAQLSQSDLASSAPDHWENLLPFPEEATTLQAYLDGPLHREWQDRLQRDPSDAFSFIRRLFGSPAVVDVNWFDALPIEMSHNLLRATDSGFEPFAITGCLRIGLRLGANTDPVLEAAGVAHLTALFDDLTYLEAALELYSCVFLLSTSVLAAHDTLGRLPVYWRRLAAAANAALVVGSTGPSSGTPGHLLEWARSVAGTPFLCSVIRDWRDEPRWRPEWIDPRHVFADVGGRVFGLKNLAKDFPLPETWHAGIEKIESEIRARQTDILCGLPAMTEGGTPYPIDISAAFHGLSEQVDAFTSEPTTRGLLTLSPFLYLFGVPEALDAALLVLVRSPGLIAAEPGDSDVRTTLNIISHIAALRKNTAMALALADTLAVMAPDAQAPEDVYTLACAVIGAAGAFQTHKEGYAFQAASFERLALGLESSEGLRHLHNLLVQYVDLDPDARRTLGRSLALAGLGGSYLRHAPARVRFERVVEGMKNAGAHDAEQGPESSR